MKKAQTVFKDVDISQVVLPIESIPDVLREAASVIAYFDMHVKFKEETCRNCGNKFAYAYYISAVKCCSIDCMAASLESIGLSWDPSAPLERRWGRYVPAIVPPVPYEILKEQIPLEEKPTPKVSDEAQNLINDLNNLI